MYFVLKLVVMSLVLMMTSFPASGGQQCSTAADVYYNPSPEEAFDAADVIFYGRDVTPEEDCPGDVGACARKIIQFQILCLIKPVGYLARIPTLPVQIGTGDPCDKTTFPYTTRNATYIVTVASKVSESLPYLYSWQEIKPGTKAKYQPNQATWLAVENTCQSETSCPAADFEASSSAVQNCEAASIECPFLWIKAGRKCIKITKGISLVRGLAREECEKEDGRLARLDQVTWSSIQRHLPNDAQTKWWTAGEKEGNETSGYVWKVYDLEDQGVDFVAWSANAVQSRMYIVVDNSLGWSTTDNNMDELGFICEKDATPARPWRPRHFQPLANRFEVTFDSPKWSVYLCCKRFSYDAEQVILTNENQGTVVSAVHLSQPPGIELPEDNTTDEVYYTILMTSHTTRLPVPTAYVTWLKMNMAPSNSTSGNTVLAYEKPIILDDEEHYFVISLYQQLHFITDGALAENGWVGAFSDCETPNSSRCEFHANLMATAQGLVLVDQLYVTASPDPYSIGSLIEGNLEDHAKVCRKYYPRTQTSGSNVVCPAPDDSGQESLRVVSIVNLISVIIVGLVSVWA